MSHVDPTSANDFLLVTPEDVTDTCPALKQRWSPRVIERECRGTSIKAESLARRKFKHRTHTAEKHWGTGEFELRLANAPITAINEVRWRGSVINGITISDDATGLVYNPSKWFGVAPFDRKQPIGLSDTSFTDPFFDGEFFPTGDGEPPWQFDYDAGLAEGSDELWELNTAAVERVLFRLELYKNAGLASERIGSYSKTADKKEQDQPFMATFLRYRLRILPGR